METIWEKTASLPPFTPLERDISTEVLVIGGGITGLLCAHFLHQANIPCVLVEAKELCNGVTGCTTAKITCQHGLIYDKLLRRFGKKLAGHYLRANEEALIRYRSLCSQIDCNFQQEDAYVYTSTDRGRLERELAALKTLGYPAEQVDKLPLPFPIAGAVRFPHQAQFHPLKFLSGIAAPLTIYTHTPVQELIGTTARTPHGKIEAKKIIIATHFPFLNKHGSYFLKLYQQRSYVLALQGAKLPEGMYLGADKDGLSFRRYNDLLLLGGGGHRTGKQGGGWEALRSIVLRYYPNAREVGHWATQDCMTLDGIPYIGPYSASTEGLYVATGFNKWGMTSAMAAATLLTDLVQGKENPYAALFSPSRTMLRPQLAVNAAEAVFSLLTPTPKRCPHMGCALKWNPQERTWDCPCHGSRFTETGKLINNPATSDLKRQ